MRGVRGRGGSESLSRALLALVIASERVLVHGRHNWRPGALRLLTISRSKLSTPESALSTYEEGLHGLDYPDV